MRAAASGVRLEDLVGRGLLLVAALLAEDREGHRHRDRAGRPDERRETRQRRRPVLDAEDVEGGRERAPAAAGAAGPPVPVPPRAARARSPVGARAPARGQRAAGRRRRSQPGRCVGSDPPTPTVESPPSPFAVAPGLGRALPTRSAPVPASGPPVAPSGRSRRSVPAVRARALPLPPEPRSRRAVPVVPATRR